MTSVESFREVTAGADAVIISVQESYEGKIPETTVQAIAASTAVAALTGPRGRAICPAFSAVRHQCTKPKRPCSKNLEAPCPRRFGKTTPSFFGHLVALQTFRASNIDWTVLTPPFGIRGWVVAWRHGHDPHGIVPYVNDRIDNQ